MGLVIRFGRHLISLLFRSLDRFPLGLDHSKLLRLKVVYVRPGGFAVNQITLLAFLCAREWQPKPSGVHRDRTQKRRRKISL
jgi:hypothetical protein